jgi:integrase/recombinase XerC
MPEPLAVPVSEDAALGPARKSDDADALVRAFLAGRRPTTLRTYAIALRDFQEFVGAPTLAHAARILLGGSHGDANTLAHAYGATLRERGFAAATINLRLTALRSFVQLARLQGLVPWTLQVQGVRAAPYRDTKGPGRRAVRALLEELASARTPRELRDRALLRLLTDLALRRGEVVALDVEDLDLAGGTVAVLGKARSAREKITMPEPTKEALAAWLAVRGSAPGALFPSFCRAGRRTRLTGTSLARIVRRIGDAAGIERLRPHGLRHAAITAALDLTQGDVRAVQRFSRHADPRTLLLYDDARRDGAGEIARLVAAWR